MIEIAWNIFFNKKIYERLKQRFCEVLNETQIFLIKKMCYTLRQSSLSSEPQKIGWDARNRRLFYRSFHRCCYIFFRRPISRKVTGGFIWRICWMRKLFFGQFIAVAIMQVYILTISWYSSTFLAKCDRFFKQ